MKHVYWLGGGSGAGKSTIAGRIAERYELRVYSTDDAMRAHATRCDPDEAPYLTRFLAMDMDERWLSRSPRTMFETFHWFRGEGFRLIVEDLLAMPADTGIIVEGFRLLPHLVKPLAEPGQAVWLLPTPDFREAAFASRGTEWLIPSQTSDPVRTRRNMLDRDAMFTDHLAEETKRLDLPTIPVDTTMTESELTSRVVQTFGLPRRGPRGS